VFSFSGGPYVAYSYPSLPSNPTRAHFQRLLWRAGYAGSRKQISHYVNLGLGNAIGELLAPFTRNVLVGPAPTDGGRKLQPLNVWGHDCLWWLDRMVRSRNQLVERMTLNLHDLFATSNAGVGNTRHMLRQNRLLRAHAVGNFADLLTQITIDPAMLLWLNGAESDRWEPNENYAREVMELFCLGNDPNLESLTHGLWTNAAMYTQNDVHEAARALTGWRYDWTKAVSGTVAQRENPTYYDRSAHDGGSKTIFGHTGAFDWKDVCRLVANHPNHAPYLAYSLWSYFIPTPPPQRAMQQMVGNYRASGQQLAPLLRVILRHPDFYANLDAPDLVKPPIVYVAAGLRTTGRFITDNNWSWLLDNMGQVPFYPPNVSGWKQGPAFLNTNTAHAYWQTAGYLLYRTVNDPGGQTPQQAVATALAALAHPWVSSDGRGKLESYAQDYVVRNGPALDGHGRTERQKVIRALVMAGPDGLLH
jgi:uncharacterized protein (DUF1800 family)